MARFKEAKGRKKGSGYARLFGNDELGALISRVHATVIKSGTELEQVIKDRVQLIANLDEFLKQEIMKDGVQVADKREVKRCVTLDFAGAEPDFLVFKRRSNTQACHVVELKDGDAFDTKKSAAEYQSMHTFLSQNARHMRYTVQAHFCCFNQDNKHAIFNGFKRRISLKEAMTGQEFCDLLELDYDEIVQARKEYGPENMREFLSELAKIEPVRKILNRVF